MEKIFDIFLQENDKILVSKVLDMPIVAIITIIWAE